MKATRATIKKRVEAVLKIRLLGAELSDIKLYASETDPETARPWNVSDRQLCRYIATGDALLARVLERDRDKLFNRHLAQHRVLYAHAVEAGDWRTALAIMRDEGELLNLYPAKKMEVSGNDRGPVVLNITEVIVNQKTPAALENING